MTVGGPRQPRTWPGAALGAVLLGLLLPAAVPAASRDITFDDLKFALQKGGAFQRTLLTPKIERLDTQRVRIRGYILPSFQQDGITQFVLVRDNQQCCFGPGAALYDCILVELATGKTTSFSVRPVAVEGVFRIKPYLGPDNKPLAVYQLEAFEVR